MKGKYYKEIWKIWLQRIYRLNKKGNFLPLIILKNNQNVRD
jgi:hypothetical protein